VEKLWMNRVFPVEGLSVEDFFRRRRLSENPRELDVCMRFRLELRLIAAVRRVQFITPKQ
jgi:hypothetical protein